MIVVSLCCVASLVLQGCYGPTASTTAPTPQPTAAPTAQHPTTAPTAQPTAAPTMVPTPSWKAVCQKSDNTAASVTLHLEEAGCNDATKQVLRASVSKTKQAAIPLVTGETCDMAVKGYLSSTCTPNKGIVEHQNGTFAACLIKKVNGSNVLSIEEDMVACDGKHKFFSSTNTVPTSYPYAQNCNFSIHAFEDGMKQNNYSCSTPAAPTAAPTPQPTSAPTAPTPQPTPAPTLVPTTPPPAWIKAVCEKVDNTTAIITVHLEEAGCNDTTNQVIRSSVSKTHQPAIPLVKGETCDMAVKGYLRSTCTPRNGTVEHQNGTFATCLVEQVNGSKVLSIEEDVVSCDGTHKFFSSTNTVPSSYPYAQNCDFSINAFEDGMKQSNYSCSTPGGPTTAPTPQPTAPPTKPHPTAAPTPSPPPTPPAPGPAPAHSCASPQWRDFDASLRNRYKNKNTNTPSKPSYLNNGLMVHGFECSPSPDGLNCYQQDYPLYNDTVKWNPECQSTMPNGTTTADSVFCPTQSDWKGTTIKQAMSFSYIRQDLPFQGIWVAGDFIDAGFILGGGTLGAKATTPRCFWQGDADTDARDGGGCGVMLPAGRTSQNTTFDPAAIYKNSCQEKLFKGADKSKWKQLFSDKSDACAVVTNIDAGAGSKDPVVQGYIADMEKESTNPFDDMYANLSACAPNCVPGGGVVNEVLIPCCQSGEVMQEAADVVQNNWPALKDLDIVAIFYMIRPSHPVPIETKKKATRRMAELLAQATGKQAVPVVGINQALLANYKADDPGLFVCDDQAQAFFSAHSPATRFLI